MQYLLNQLGKSFDLRTEIPEEGRTGVEGVEWEGVGPAPVHQVHSIPPVAHSAGTMLININMIKTL